MGKVKNSRKHRKNLTMKAEPISQAPVSTAVRAQAQNVLTDISSVDARRRERACVVIANIFGTEASNMSVMDKMSTADLLGKLCMRLIDSCDAVRTHAAGAIRNMASCRSPVVSQRMIDAGIVGSIVSLAAEGLQAWQAAPDEGRVDFIEQLISTASNLCAACETAVDEILTKNFLAILLQVLQLAGVPTRLKTAAACCIYTATDAHTAACEYIFRHPDGMSAIINTATDDTTTNAISGHTTAEAVQRKTSQLYAVGAVANIYLSFLASYRADSVGRGVPDESTGSLLREAAERMQGVLGGVLAALQLRDEVLNDIVNPAIDETSCNPMGDGVVDIDEDNNDTERSSLMKGADGDDDEGEAGDEGIGGGGLVLVAKDVDRTWAMEMDVTEIAAEILANMACVVRNSFLDDVLHSSSGSYVSTYEWTGDDEDNEKRMDALAAATVAVQEGVAGDGRSVGKGSEEICLVFDTRGAVGAALGSLTQLTSALSVITQRARQLEAPFTSPGLELIVSVDRVLAALTNLFYLMDPWQGEDLASILEQLFLLFHTLCDIFTALSQADDNSHTSADTSGTPPWMLSPLLTSPSVSRAIRSCLVSCAQAVSTLHEGQSAGMVALLTAQGEALDRLRGLRIEGLLRGIGALPILEVMQPCFEVICLLAEPHDESTGSPFLDPYVVQVLTEALIGRVFDPSALRVADPADIPQGGRQGAVRLADGSLLVMEGCLSTLIDLHSSDDERIFQIYRGLDMSSRLQEAYQNFRSKLRVEGDGTYSREDVGRCKETLLNLKRFIKYKEK